MDANERAVERMAEWFRANAGNPEIEIEARLGRRTEEGFVAEVTQRRYLEILSVVRGFNLTESKTSTLDVSHGGGVRRTIDLAAGGRDDRIQRKTTLDRIDLGYVRFQLAQEEVLALDSEEAMQILDSGVEPQVYRFKDRVSFEDSSKGFRFDLTEVRSGETRDEAEVAPMTFEVEVEFSGMDTDRGRSVMRVEDGDALVVDEVADGARCRALAEEVISRVQDLQATPDSEPVYRVRGGAQVTLRLPCPRFGHTLPGRVARQVRWTGQKYRPGPGGEPRMMIMSMPGKADIPEDLGGGTHVYSLLQYVSVMPVKALAKLA